MEMPILGPLTPGLGVGLQVIICKCMTLRPKQAILFL